MLRKKRAPKKPTLSKTAVLEEKINGIVDLLHHRAQPPLLSPAATPNQLETNSLGTPIQTTEIVVTRSYAPPTPVASSVSTATPPFPDLEYPCPDDHQSTLTLSMCPVETDAELDSILNAYRSNMLPFFPVAIVDTHTTVQQMQNTYPFLWLVIRACCSKSHRRQNTLELEVRKRLGHAVLMDCSKDLDLFFGVLVYAAWCHYYIYKKRVISTVIQLGISIAADMGLNKPIPAETNGVMREFNAQGCPRVGKMKNQSRTIEERRAIIGLFYVSSL
jgi:hypothetical protein